jgi:hypothetical protein
MILKVTPKKDKYPKMPVSGKLKPQLTDIVNIYVGHCGYLDTSWQLFEYRPLNWQGDKMKYHAWMVVAVLIVGSAIPVYAGSSAAANYCKAKYGGRLISSEEIAPKTYKCASISQPDLNNAKATCKAQNLRFGGIIGVKDGAVKFKCLPR